MPAKKKTTGRGVPIGIRFSPEEDKLIAKHMKKRGFTSKSDFLRSLIHQCEDQVVTKGDLAAVVRKILSENKKRRKV